MTMLRRHFSALILSVVTALAIGLPQFVVIQQMGVEYQGIFPISSDDDRYYEARSHEVRDGFSHLGNPYIYELRDAPAVSFWMPDAMLSYAGTRLGLDVQHTFALFDFVLPVLLFLVLYATLVLATGSSFISLLATTLFHLGFFLDAFTQSPSPQFNFLFLEVSFLTAVAVVQRVRFAPYVLGITLGSLFYVYPYFWTFAFGAIGVFFIATLLRTELREYRAPLFFALLAGTILGAPVLLQMLLAGKLQAYQETILRLGMIYSHVPGGLASILLAGIALGACMLVSTRVPQLRREPLLWFFSSIVLGGIISANHNVITGQNLEFSSHYFLPVAYVVLLAFTYLCVALDGILSPGVRTWYLRVGVVVAVLFLVLNGAVHSIATRVAVGETARDEQKYGPVMHWLNQNTVPESVVMAAEDTSYLIAAYTHDRIFYSRNANLHIMTDHEVWTRFTLLYYDEPLTDAFFSTHVGQIWGAHYFDEYGHQSQLNKVRKLLGMSQIPVEVIPQKAKDEFLSFVRSIRSKPPQEILANRRIDYVVVEPGFRYPEWLLEVYPRMFRVFQTGEFEVYSLNR